MLLTPVTALWAAILGLLSLALAGQVVRARASEKVIFGDGASVLLQQRIRVHGNFVEYVPLALLFLFLVELNGAWPLWVLHGLGGSLALGRLLHAFGLSTSTGTTPGRFLGTVLTWLVMLVECVLLLFCRHHRRPRLSERGERGPPRASPASAPTSDRGPMSRGGRAASRRRA